MSEPATPPTEPSAPAASAVRKSRMTKSLVLLVVAPAVLVGALYGGRLAWHAWNKHQIEELSNKAETCFEKRDLDGASQALREIVKFDVQNERALRLWARITDSIPHTAEDAVAVWRRICETPHATVSDRAFLGCALVGANRYQEGLDIWKALPESEREHRAGLELHAAILRYEGNVHEADQTLRRAYESAPDDPQARLKLAALDLSSSFPEIRTRAARGLWELTHSPKENESVTAMQLLASMQDLTVSQAEELERRLNEMKDVTGAPRFAVLTGCMKALPMRRAQILDNEIKRHPGKPNEDSVDFMRWLLINRESDRILTMMDKSIALRSRPLFPIYAEALNISSRWTELQALLTSSNNNLPISKATAAVMLARCSNKLNESTTHVRTHLQEAMRAAQSHHSMPELLLAANSADEMGFADLAVDAFGELTEQPAYRSTALEHILDLRHRQGNLNAILATLETLLEDSPGKATYLDLLCYHKILAGEEIEKMARIAQRSIDAGHQASPTLHLALALAAFRAHDLSAAAQEAKAVPPLDLPVGQRAVLAGILSACGQMDVAFHLAEKISPGLLLVEETRFLKGVL